jgi:hypothetical protein
MDHSIPSLRRRAEICALISQNLKSIADRDQWATLALTWLACAEDAAYLGALKERLERECRLKCRAREQILDWREADVGTCHLAMSPPAAKIRSWANDPLEFPPP